MRAALDEAVHAAGVSRRAASTRPPGSADGSASADELKRRPLVGGDAGRSHGVALWLRMAGIEKKNEKRTLVLHVCSVSF